MKRIILTGGGTAGHVTPNIALLPTLKALDYEVHYIGSYDGIEKKLIEEQGIPYYGIASGKLRRYFDPKNFTDPFKVLKGYSQSVSLLKKIKPDIIFSKGGFVSVPVVIAAKKCKIPAVIHESDMTPGLANKLAIPSATKICCNFPETLNYLPKEKAVLTGSPIRKELLKGNRNAGLKFCGFTKNFPVIMIIGGSLGSVTVNDAVRKILPQLTKNFQIIHICGKDKIDPSFKNTANYIQFEFVKKELADLFAASDLVISRAGANAICELLALRKPNLLIPLSANASRGDQILNGRSFEKQGFSILLEEENLTPEVLLSKINDLYEHRLLYIQAMEQSTQTNAVEKITGIIQELLNQ